MVRRLRGRRRPRRKFGNVAALWEGYQDWVIGAFTPVERFEPVAQSSGLDSDDGVGLGVKGRAPAQGLDRNYGLFDFSGPAGERAHNDKSQEATGAFGIGKGCTGQDAIEL